jgi:hypothetical protein
MSKPTAVFGIAHLHLRPTKMSPKPVRASLPPRRFSHLRSKLVSTKRRIASDRVGKSGCLRRHSSIRLSNSPESRNSKRSFLISGGFGVFDNLCTRIVRYVRNVVLRAAERRAPTRRPA